MEAANVAENEAEAEEHLVAALALAEKQGPAGRTWANPSTFLAYSILSVATSRKRSCYFAEQFPYENEHSVKIMKVLHKVSLTWPKSIVLRIGKQMPCNYSIGYCLL